VQTFPPGSLSAPTPTGGRTSKPIPEDGHNRR
jgi:hypothetical protein